MSVKSYLAATATIAWLAQSVVYADPQVDQYTIIPAYYPRGTTGASPPPPPPPPPPSSCGTGADNLGLQSVCALSTTAGNNATLTHALPGDAASLPACASIQNSGTKLQGVYFVNCGSSGAHTTVSNWDFTHYPIYVDGNTSFVDFVNIKVAGLGISTNTTPGLFFGGAIGWNGGGTATTPTVTCTHCDFDGTGQEPNNQNEIILVAGGSYADSLTHMHGAANWIFSSRGAGTVRTSSNDYWECANLNGGGHGEDDHPAQGTDNNDSILIDYTGCWQSITATLTVPSVYCEGSVGTANCTLTNSIVILPAGMTSGATFTASISGTNMTVTGSPTGPLVIGQVVTGAGVTGGTLINSQTSGTHQGAGVYVVSASQTVGSESMSVGPLTGFTAAAGSSGNITVTGSALDTGASGYFTNFGSSGTVTESGNLNRQTGAAIP